MPKVTRKEAADAIASLRYARRKQLQSRTRAQLKLAGMLDTPAVAEAVQRFKEQLSTSGSTLAEQAGQFVAKARNAVDTGKAPGVFSDVVNQAGHGYDQFRDHYAVNRGKQIVSDLGGQAAKHYDRLQRFLQTARGRQLLTGLAGGALAGAGSEFMFGSGDEQGRRHYGRSALLGAGLGSAVTTGGFGLMDNPNLFGSSDQPSQTYLNAKPFHKRTDSAKQAAAFKSPLTETARKLRQGFKNPRTQAVGQTYAASAAPKFPMPTPGNVKPLPSKKANMPGLEAPPSPMAQGGGLPPELSQLAGAQQPQPQKTPMELLSELPNQLTSEIQSKQQALHGMLGDQNVALADKLQALGKMLKGLPDPPEEPMDVLREGGLAQQLPTAAPKMAAFGEQVMESGKGLIDKLKTRLADPSTRISTSTALGAGLGGAASLTAEAVGKRKNKRYLNALLTGAGAGAMLGGGGAYISNEMGKSSLLGGAEPSLDPRKAKIEEAARKLDSQLPSNLGEAASEINKLDHSAQPSVGELATTGAGTIASTAPLTTMVGGGLLARDAVDAGIDLNRGERFRSRTQLDPSAIRGKKPVYRQSYAHKLTPEQMAEAATNSAVSQGGLGEMKDRLKAIFRHDSVRDSLLTNTNHLNSRIEDLIEQGHGGGMAMGSAELMAEIKRLGRELVGNEETLPHVIGNDAETKRVQGAIEKLKEQLGKHEGEKALRSRLFDTLGPGKARSQLLDDIEVAVPEEARKLSPIRQKSLGNAHRPGKAPMLSMRSGLGRGMVGAAGVMDAINLLGQFLQSGGNE